VLDRIWFDEIEEAPESSVVAMPEPDADGWCSWGADGTIRDSVVHPWLDGSTEVEVELRVGSSGKGLVSIWDWSVDGKNSGDIMRYRVIVNPKQEVPTVPEAPATEPEPKWLPPQQEGFGPWILHDGSSAVPEGLSGKYVIWCTWLNLHGKYYTPSSCPLLAHYLDFSRIAAYAVKEDSTEGVNTKE
jgi:hypothetical protein